MPHLPLNIDVRGMTVLVVGGGFVAGRKIKALLAKFSVHLDQVWNREAARLAPRRKEIQHQDPSAIILQGNLLAR